MFACIETGSEQLVWNVVGLYLWKQYDYTELLKNKTDLLLFLTRLCYDAIFVHILLHIFISL